MSCCHIYYVTSVILYIYSGYVTASEYCVSTASNNVYCNRTNLPCYNLSYYTADYASYFTDDTIFYFLEGTHTLEGILEINGVSNITLQGLGHIEQGFHETVMQSTSVITCSDNNRTGIQFNSSTDVVLKMLTVTNCGFDTYIRDKTYPRKANVSILFVDMINVTLEWVSAQNSLGFGLCLVNTIDVLIADSSFVNNGAPEPHRGNVLILYDDQLETLSKVNIVKSNFTLGLGYGMVLWYDNDNGAKVIIEDSVFSQNAAQYEGGGIYIHLNEGSGSIDFISCTIHSNTAQYRGGGVHIDLQGNGSIEFNKCTIYNNTSLRFGGGVNVRSYEHDSLEFKNCAIYNNTAQNYGGGADIYSKGYGIVQFNNCTVYNNTSLRYGGGMNIHSSGYDSIEFGNCIIYNNNAQYDGGGVYIDLFEGGGSVEICKCTICNNIARYGGGGVYIDLYEGGRITEFGNCTINNNTAYLGSGLFLHAFQISSTASFYFKNVLFHFNKATNKLSVYRKVYQSAVVLFNVVNVTFDQIEVSNHNTTGLVGFNSQLTFDRHSKFVNNSGIYGGGIALYESSYLFLLKEHTNVSFVDNHASKSGGGIFVSPVDISTECSFILNNSYCNSSALLYFVNNKADISGDVLYGGNVDKCLNEDEFNNLFHYPNQTGLSAVSSDPLQVCFCKSEIPNCSVTNISKTVIPGVDVSVSLATVGLKDGLTEGAINLSSADSSSTVQTDNNRLNANCTNVIFTLKTNLSSNTAQVYVKLDGSISGPFLDPSVKVIDVTIESCPIGFPLVNDTCVCRPELNTSSISCDINTQIITRNGDMWIGYENDSECLIIYQNCPFDYCSDGTIHFIVTSPNAQCLHNRFGLLCGQCAEGLSLMLGSNECGQCTNDHIPLFIAFAVAGIVLVAFVIVLNLTVSVGTINGLIFYANAVKIYEPYFFPNGSVPFVSQFISWLNLDLGIRTCFYNSMDSCSKAWLQFIFPGYVWFILILIIILSRYSSKVVRLVGRQAIPVLATMILLSYTKLIRTVFHVLYYTNIQCNDDTLLRWTIDANVQYVGGCHLPLFLVSLAVFILLIVPYTFFLLTIPLFEGPLSKYMCYCQKLSTYMKHFFDAYGGPYKDTCRFWTGFLLLVRVVLALVVSLDTETSVRLDVLTCILIFIAFIYLYSRGMYQQFPLVCLEVSFLLNLALMAYVNVQISEKSKRQVSSILLVSVAFVVFCGIILYHVWDRLLKSYSQQTIAKVKEIFKKPPPPSSSNDTELTSTLPRSPDVDVDVVRKSTTTSVLSMEMRRESLLFDD